MQEQREVATEIGVHHQTLALWERSRTSPAVRHWPGILRFLGYDPNPQPQSIAELLMQYGACEGGARSG